MEFTIIIYYNHTVPIISVAFATYCLYKNEYKFMKKGSRLVNHIRYVFVETLTNDTNDFFPPHQSRWSSNVSLLQERTYTDFGAEVHRLWCGGISEFHRLWYWLTFDLLLIYNICSVMKVTTQSLGHDNIFYFPTQIFNTSDYQCFTY